MTRTAFLAAFVSLFLLAGAAQADLISVAGPSSTLGTPPAIIPAPAHALDDIVTNTGMQGFDEAQDVVTTVAHSIDGGGVIPVGTFVDSHMIILNSEGATALSHREVIWTFSGTILGVMSDSGGLLEAASTFELGNPATNYTVTFGGSGPAAPYNARGMEGADTYQLLSPNTLKVYMTVTEPGDWIRVVTTGDPVPEPGSLALLGLGLTALVWRRRSA